MWFKKTIADLCIETNKATCENSAHFKLEYF